MGSAKPAAMHDWDLAEMQRLNNCPEGKESGEETDSDSGRRDRTSEAEDKEGTKGSRSEQREAELRAAKETAAPSAAAGHMAATGTRDDIGEQGQCSKGGWKECTHLGRPRRRQEGAARAGKGGQKQEQPRQKGERKTTQSSKTCGDSFWFHTKQWKNAREG